MRHFSEVLQSSRKWVALFALTVLFPALLLALVAVRAFLGEGSWQRYQEKERQEQIVRLLERDLDDWLFSIRSKPPTPDSLFKFQIRGDEILFPVLNVTLSTNRPREASALSFEDLSHWYETQRNEWVAETAASRDQIQSVYLRLMETRPRLAPLARLSLFRIALQARQSQEAVRRLSAIHQNDREAVTESGVPTWIAAALMLASSTDACSETNAAGRACSAFVKTALAGLREGRWKLTAAQWIVYVEEFRSALQKYQETNRSTPPWGDAAAALSGAVQRLQTLAELHPQLLSLHRGARAATSGIAAEKRYEPKLKSFIVFLSFAEATEGLILDAGLLKPAAQQGLDKLTVAEDFRGTISFEQNGGSTNQQFRLASFPAIQIQFTQKEQAGGLLRFRKHLFLYVTGFLLLVCVLGLFYTYRAVSHEVAVSRLKADFVAAVSHEFRSPLTSILALLERVETGKVRDPGTLSRYHRVIHQEVHRLNLLVNSLLDFARLEEGRKEFSFQPCNVRELVKEVVQSFHNLGHGERVNLVENQETDLPEVSADRMAIAQCIQNLIDNGIKYSPKDFPVLVETGRENGIVYLEVSDRGPGIPLSEQDRIFEQFYRAKNTDIHNVKGAGLGLALVKRIMESHGGRVTVESRPGEGSKFRLIFPLGR